jgi:dihydrofolate synthase/folylpolyglutamate synthase
MGNVKEIINKIYALQNFGVKLGLENTIKFLDLIGNPQLKLKFFHIAGSNGKGSTASFISSILIENKFSTALYTSPHFVRFNERIKINGKEVPDEFVTSFYLTHEEYILKNKLTFFEVTTAMAFKYFADNSVDYAVIETGLGGRLDATNVINPLASVITSISLEHTNILGNTIEEITKEKAEIIKPGTKVFLGNLPVESAIIIEKKCEDVGTELFYVDDFIIKREKFIELYTEELSMDRLDSPLKGYYQKYNAALAALTVNKTIHIYKPYYIQKGIENVVRNAGLQGRYEIFSNKPKLIMDSAHNPDGVKNFITEFVKESKAYKKKILLFTALKDKDINRMLGHLKGVFDEIHVTEIDIERASAIDEIAIKAAELDIPVIPEKDFLSFINNYLTDRESINSCLVILGSMYLLGEIKKSLLKINLDN